MIRKIIKIDEEKCNGCKACAHACHEGAIEMINGVAKLTREDYCDGLGDCLPTCPTGAITFEEREALEYDEAAVLKAKEEKTNACPSGNAKRITRNISIKETISSNSVSQLNQWPVQIKLVSPNAAYFDNAKLLIAADCTAYAYANFHERFIKNHITIIGCPKLDMVDYSQKLTQILKYNDIKSITVVRMEVPCCSGIEASLKKALINSGKLIPWNLNIISTNGNLIED